MSSLPVPVSPRISTLASVSATVSTWFSTVAQHGALADDLIEGAFSPKLVLQVELLLSQRLRETVCFS